VDPQIRYVEKKRKRKKKRELQYGNGDSKEEPPQKYKRRNEGEIVEDETKKNMEFVSCGTPLPTLFVGAPPLDVLCFAIHTFFLLYVVFFLFCLDFFFYFIFLCSINLFLIVFSQYGDPMTRSKVLVVFVFF